MMIMATAARLAEPVFPTENVLIKTEMFHRKLSSLMIFLRRKSLTGAFQGSEEGQSLQPR